MKLIRYMIRWQLSTPMLALCVAYLPFNPLAKTILANIIGGLIFYKIDQYIFTGGDKIGDVKNSNTNTGGY